MKDLYLSYEVKNSLQTFIITKSSNKITNKEFFCKCKSNNTNKVNNSLIKKKKTTVNLIYNKFGKWTYDEHFLFVIGILIYGKNWYILSQMVKTRTKRQIISHSQKFFLYLKEKELYINIQEHNNESSQIPKKESFRNFIPSNNYCGKKRIIKKLCSITCSRKFYSADYLNEISSNMSQDIHFEQTFNNFKNNNPTLYDLLMDNKKLDFIRESEIKNDNNLSFNQSLARENINKNKDQFYLDIISEDGIEITNIKNDSLNDENTNNYFGHYGGFSPKNFNEEFGLVHLSKYLYFCEKGIFEISSNSSECTNKSFLDIEKNVHYSEKGFIEAVTSSNDNSTNFVFEIVSKSLIYQSSYIKYETQEKIARSN